MQSPLLCKSQNGRLVAPWAISIWIWVGVLGSGVARVPFEFRFNQVALDRRGLMRILVLGKRKAELARCAKGPTDRADHPASPAAASWPSVGCACKRGLRTFDIGARRRAVGPKRS